LVGLVSLNKPTEYLIEEGMREQLYHPSKDTIPHIL
jgi:hypothetical protein